jgi:hypothetical protein
MCYDVIDFKDRLLEDRYLTKDAPGCACHQSSSNRGICTKTELFAVALKR